MKTAANADSRTDFFDGLKDWSEIKLRILAKYFRAYLYKRGSGNPKIFYVDGFAGTGRYGENEEEYKEGSPVRMAKFVQELDNSPRPYQLVCINTEIDPGRFAKLQESLSHFDPALVQTRLGAFEEHLPDILKLTRGAPALFFLDPFGVQPIKLRDLLPLLRRPDTELLLNLNTRELRRLAGFEDSDTKQAKAKLRLVNQVLGERPDDPTPEWLRAWRQLQDGIAWEHWAARAYMDRLIGESPYLRYAAAYPIRESYRGNPKYYLVFATRSIDAMVIMNDLLCTEEDDLFTKTESVASNGQISLFGDTYRRSEQETRLAELLDEIHAYGLQHQGCTRDDLINHFVMEKFGEFRTTHYRQAVEKLVKGGRARFAKQQKKSLDAIMFL